MKKKLICGIIALTICFNPMLGNDTVTSTSVTANNGIRINIALNNQTKGGGYNITLTDSNYNSITKAIPTSGSTAYFEDILTDIEYMVTITHADNPTELWYFGKHNFASAEYGQTIYMKVTDTPVQNYTFTGNYTQLDGYSSKIGVAGAYANINEATVHTGYFSSYINSDYEVDHILATFNVNGFVTGDAVATIIVDLDYYLPAFFAVVKLDSENNNIESIYYNTNSYPITRLNERMFSLSVSDFENSSNFAVVQLKEATTPTVNFYNSIPYRYYTYTPASSLFNTSVTTPTTSSNYSSGGSIPTLGYISAFRNVAIGDIINLDELNISGVTGWYYDIIYKNQVQNTSAVEVTQEILNNGLYPRLH